MSDAVSGLLGGIMGASNAVNELSAERRKEMAVALRQQAMAEIEKKYQERGFKQQEKIQGADIAARKEGSEADITSREKIATDRNAMLEKLSKAELGMKQQVLNMDKKSTDAQNLKAKISAFTEARKIIEGGGSTEEANAVLDAAGLPSMEEYTIEPGREGILGFFQKDPVVGRRVAGSAGSSGNAMPASGGLKGELASLLEESKKGGISKPPGGQQITAAEFHGTDSAKDVIEPKPEPKGIMSTAIAGAVPKQKQELGDPVDWNVVKQSSQYFMKTADGMIQMTPEQIQQWKAATGKK